MDIHKFEATTKYEIGDSLKFPNGSVRKIIDIACVHYCKSGQNFFLYKLDNSDNYKTLFEWALENTKTND